METMVGKQKRVKVLTVARATFPPECRIPSEFRRKE